MTKGIPGPERSRTWVNQPEAMHGSKQGTAHVTGQARFANAVYVYQPDFTGAYKEGVVSEANRVGKREVLARNIDGNE